MLFRKAGEPHLSICLWICSRYRGDNSPTNMVILDIGMLSGFVPDPDSVKLVSEQQEFRVNQ